MNIHINYNKNDYAADVIKIAHIKNELLFLSNYMLEGIGVLIAFFFIFIGIANEGVIHESAKHHNNNHVAGFIFASVGISFLLVILIFLGLQIWAKKSSLKKAENFNVDEVAEINLSFTDEMFTYRDKKRYYECAWGVYSSYLVIGGFIFLCRDNLRDSFAFGQKQLYKEQSDELITFLASKLPVWK